MNATPLSVSATELYAHLDTVAASLLVDVRPEDVFDDEECEGLYAILHTGLP